MSGLCKQKRNYLLLELVLGLTLLTLGLAPLIRAPWRVMRLEREALLDMELERIADAAFAEILVLLDQNALSLTHLKMDDKRVEVDLDQKYSFDSSVRVTESSVQDQKDCCARLLRVELTLTPKRGKARCYTRRFCVRAV
jgi:hypothetical protein